MENSKYLFLQIASLILLLSLPPSYAHNKSHESMPPPTGSQAKVAFKGCLNKVYAFDFSDTETRNAHNLGDLKSIISTLFSHAWSPYCSSENSNLSGIDYLMAAQSLISYVKLSTYPTCQPIKALPQTSQLVQTLQQPDQRLFQVISSIISISVIPLCGNQIQRVS